MQRAPRSCSQVFQRPADRMECCISDNLPPDMSLRMPYEDSLTPLQDYTRQGTLPSFCEQKRSIQPYHDEGKSGSVSLQYSSNDLIRSFASSGTATSLLNISFTVTSSTP